MRCVFASCFWCMLNSHQVSITRGHYAGQQGKVVQVYRRKWCIHVERIQREKANGATVNIPIHPSKVSSGNNEPSQQDAPCKFPHESHHSCLFMLLMFVALLVGL